MLRSGSVQKHSHSLQSSSWTVALQPCPSHTIRTSSSSLRMLGRRGSLHVVMRVQLLGPKRMRRLFDQKQRSQQRMLSLRLHVSLVLQFIDRPLWLSLTRNGIGPDGSRAILGWRCEEEKYAQVPSRRAQARTVEDFRGL